MRALHTASLSISLSRRGFVGAALGSLPAFGAAAQERSQSLSGAGSTFVQPLMDRWGRAFAAHEGEGGAAVAGYARLDYEPVGSAGGVVRLLQGAVDFAATDVAMAPEELDRHGLAQFPVVSGGVAVAVNLPLPTGATPRLSGAVLARIGLGQITRWSDPAIAALQDGVAMPDAPITVLRRADGSGTTWNYTAFLARRSEAWRTAPGVGWSVPWPVGTAARGTRGMVEALRATPGAIAYLEAGEAARSGMRVAAIDNAAGRFVIPDAAALDAGLAALPWATARHFHQEVAEPLVADAYPILATVFAVMRRRPASATGSRAALAFFRMGLAERADDARALGFVPLSPALVSQVAAHWPAVIRGAR
ncbi:phosphate ABC transporter substrate-binding protein PstS [Roseomonas sp. CECT 9278]|uniref:phosphate ABC transporter substrate-binding protein PstS n=1 Tax=Roseomonas sp. CECT 9278 TaxID=2845823 RepID=UPI001E573D0F|nr:phosphate ABC transporter substrate-binding protein PstS [Roseomonas sp. CECT 9278]CAH0141948.1 Phosphate-binding protein PstS [Roseomonas sp. CECT 9278]